MENLDCKAKFFCLSCWYNLISYENKFRKSIKLVKSNKTKNIHENSLVWDPVPFMMHIHWETYCLIIFVFRIYTLGKIPFEKQFCWTSWNRNLLYCSTQCAGLCGYKITSLKKIEAVINSVIKSESEGGIGGSPVNRLEASQRLTYLSRKPPFLSLLCLGQRQ